MPIIIRPDWHLPDSAATDEAQFKQRRTLMKGMATGAIAGAALPGFLAASPAMAQSSQYPATRNRRYTVERQITPERLATTYTNFYEFGTSKNIWRKAQALKTKPWEVTIDGLVEKPIKIDAHDLIARMQLEERVYRFRCVEAWAMTVPWTGFPMAKLLEFARPSSRAKYVRMETFQDPDVAQEQKQFWQPWPYTEGLTMAEAGNELTMMVTGMYGKPAPPQNGAPLRLIVPWKYGFKSIKSIVRFTFTDKRPVSFWEEINAKEYGFWANVNPGVSHPRWSQATERLLNGGRVDTRIYNGYGDQVAGLYKGMNIGDNLYR